MHDFSSSGQWSPQDVRRMYGLFDSSTDHVLDSHKVTAVQRVFHTFDKDASGTISKDEFVTAWNGGTKLPDLGFGPGHHGDAEYEYEIHHFEKYHSDNPKVEDLVHPEDIEHFKMHEDQERQDAEWEALVASGIVEKNIPAKFLRAG
jgi:hypothetical protein